MGLDGISNISASAGEQSIPLTSLKRLQQGIPQLSGNPANPPFFVNLSNEAKLLSDGQRAGNSASQTAGGAGGVTNSGECQTCKNRRYVDRSNDATVSFQTPTRVSPGAAEGAVRSHEQQHVTNEQQNAKEQGQKVVYQSVSIQYSICPECGTSYVAGGTTTTVTKADTQKAANIADPLSNGSLDLRV